MRCNTDTATNLIETTGWTYIYVFLTIPCLLPSARGFHHYSTGTQQWSGPINSTVATRSVPVEGSIACLSLQVKNLVKKAGQTDWLKGRPLHTKQLAMLWMRENLWSKLKVLLWRTQMIKWNNFTADNESFSGLYERSP